MKRHLAALVAVAALAAAVPAGAQELGPAPGTVVVTLIPAGGTFFTQAKDSKAPSFGNYGVGAAADVTLNRFISLEGEVTGALGVTQDLDFTTGTQHVKSPSVLNYSGNVVFSAPAGSSLVPYVAGGVGGLTLFDKASLGIADRATFFTGNVGGGLKWFNGRWGLRADYRFLMVRSKDDAPAFFGQETRYGHRVYGGLLINVGR
jgi:hypothetical protein